MEKYEKKHEWKCVIESTCLVISLHLVQARMVKTCPKKVNKKMEEYEKSMNWNVW